MSGVSWGLAVCTEVRGVGMLSAPFPELMRSPRQWLPSVEGPVSSAPASLAYPLLLHPTYCWDFLVHPLVDGRVG